MAASFAALTSLAGHLSCKGTGLAFRAGLPRFVSTGAMDSHLPSLRRATPALASRGFARAAESSGGEAGTVGGTLSRNSHLVNVTRGCLLG